MYCIVHVQVPRRKQPRLLISSRADDCGMANKNGNAKVGGGAAHGIITCLGLHGKAKDMTMFSPWDGRVQEGNGSYG